MEELSRIVLKKGCKLFSASVELVPKMTKITSLNVKLEPEHDVEQYSLSKDVIVRTYCNKKIV